MIKNLLISAVAGSETKQATVPFNEAPSAQANQNGTSRLEKKTKP